MLKIITKSFLITILIVVPVFANDALSTFHQQGDLDYPEPIGEEAYFATKAPLPQKTSAYFGFNLGGNFIPLKTEISVDSKPESQKKDVSGLNAGVYTGYAVNIGRLYLGGELGLATNFLDETIKDTINSQDVKLKMYPLKISG